MQKVSYDLCDEGIWIFQESGDAEGDFVVKTLFNLPDIPNKAVTARMKWGTHPWVDDGIWEWCCEFRVTEDQDAEFTTPVCGSSGVPLADDPLADADERLFYARSAISFLSITLRNL